MGQSSSALQGEHGCREAVDQVTSPISLTTDRPESRTRQAPREEWPLSGGESSSTQTSGHLARVFRTFRRPASVHLSSAGSNLVEERTSTSRIISTFESEERPLVRREGSQTPNTSIHDNIVPTPRPHSVTSRLGLRFRQRYSLLSQTPEGRFESLDQNTDTPSPSLDGPISGSTAELGSSSIRRRFSVLNHLSRGPFRANSRTSASARLGPISGPILHAEDGETDHQNGTVSSFGHAAAPSSATLRGPEEGTQDPPHFRRRSRLSRARQSISGPLENLFRSSYHEANSDPQTLAVPRRSTRSREADDADNLIPSRLSQSPDIDHDEPASRASDATGSTPLESLGALLENPSASLLSPQEQAEQTVLAGHDARERRRTPQLLQGRSSRLIRRDDETSLARILQVAAAAIAAQLSGTTDALANLEAMGEDHFDGGLNAFVEELNNATGQPNGTPRDNRNNDGASPLNFWRVFRFANNQEIINEGEAQQEQASINAQELMGSRTVTVVLVGVRSVPSSTVNRERSEAVGTGLDTLLNLSDLPRTVPSGAGLGSSLLRSVTGRSRLSRRRSSRPQSSMAVREGAEEARRPLPAWMSNIDSISSDQASLSSDILSAPALSPGHHSPPSASLRPLSSSPVPSRETTSSRARSSAEQSEEMRRLLSLLRGRRNVPSPAQSDPNEGAGGLRARRRSDSEANRHRENGARDSRRNGIVAPEGQRSWMIYVVGTNLEEDHPALNGSTIFSDVGDTFRRTWRRLLKGAPSLEKSHTNASDLSRIPPTKTY